MIGHSPSVLPGGDDTIAAMATAPGRGALAIVRLSGPAALVVAERVVSPWPLAERRATLCSVRHPDSGMLLDHAMVTVFEGTRSFTGEPTVEIATHGGMLVPASVLAALLAAGARQALPGEFTRRAVMRGRLDLLQAEAIGDLIDARSGAAHRSALHQLDGGLSARIGTLRDSVIQLEALIAYDLDFPEEDDGPISRDRVLGATDSLLEALATLLRTSRSGELIREGALVVLAGPPNAGKSSLFNALLGHARAIVTDVPGTTRDALEAVIDAGAWPLRLVDTAGLRETADVVERLGVEVSERYLAAADVVLACGESADEVDAVLVRVRAITPAALIAVETKADLARESPSVERDANADEAVTVSALTGAGLEELLECVHRVVAAGGGVFSADEPMLTRERHRVAIETARREVAEFRRAWADRTLPGVVAAVHLRTAATALEELIGTVDVEDVLDRVFASFCIGK